MKKHLVYTFDEYRIDPARRELWRGDAQVSVQPKAFECLAYLIEHRDRVVGTDELISAVWGSVDLTDNVVMHSIARARQAVGDNGSRQRAIRTVTRVGYSWNLPVEATTLDLFENGGVNDHASPAGDPSVPHKDAAASSGFPALAGRPVRRPVLSRRWRAAATVTFAIAIATVLLPGGSHSPPAPVEGEAAIVLPVTLVGSSDSGDAWIRLGIMDLVAERLRELGQLVVPSDNTVTLARTYIESNGAHGPEDIEMLARTAAAGLVLDAQAEVIGDRWRVSLNTVHGREPAIAAQGDAPDLLTAARAASDRMAVMLGFELAAADAAASETSRIDHVLQQVRAAGLSDRFEEVARLLSGLDDAERDDPRVRYLLGAVESRMGQYDNAVTIFNDLLHDLADNGRSLLRGKILYGLSFVHHNLGEHDQALVHSLEALDVLEGKRDYESQLVTGKVLAGLGTLQLLEGQMDEAQATFARARFHLESSGDQWSLAVLDANMADLFTRMGRPEAVPLAQRAADRLGAYGDVQNELRARSLLAIAYYYEPNMSAALAEVSQFSGLLEKVDNPDLESHVSTVALGLSVEAGQFKIARELLNRIRDKSTRSSVYGTRAEAFAARLAFAEGDFESAAASAESAVQGNWSLAFQGEKAVVWRILHHSQLRLGLDERAHQTLIEATRWSESLQDDKSVSMHIALMHARQAAFAADSVGARSAFEEAIGHADRLRNPIVTTIVTDPYVEWLIREGDLENARIVAGGVTPWVERNYRAALTQIRLYHAMNELTGWRLALERTRALAGEREIPPELLEPPVQLAATP